MGENREKPVFLSENRVKSFFNVFAPLISALIGGVIGASLVITFPNWSKYLPSSILPTKVAPVVQEQTEKRIVIDEESEVIKVVEKASPAVVSVVAKSIDLDPFTGPVDDQRGVGTGFITSDNGVILTNNHVVNDEANQYQIITKDNRTFPVETINRDALNDIAILTVKASSLPTLELGDSSKIKVGQKVVAIGNALGRFSNTVTTGVVSGIGRGVTASDPVGLKSETLEGVIQTDAALNPGNSGGPLLDLSGRVIGINFAITEGAQNIGFVIPVNIAKPVVEGFIKEGRIIKAFLGVGYRVIDSGIARFRNLPEGALVQSVIKDSPADKAGIKAGDVVTLLGGNEINSTNPLSKEIGKRKVGESIEITVYRDGKNITLKATLEEAPKS